MVLSIFNSIGKNITNPPHFLSVKRNLFVKSPSANKIPPTYGRVSALAGNSVLVPSAAIQNSTIFTPRRIKSKNIDSISPAKPRGSSMPKSTISNCRSASRDQFYIPPTTKPRPKAPRKTDNNLNKKNYDVYGLLNSVEEIDPYTFIIPNFNPARYSTKKNAEVEAYAAITHEGLVRDYNEDRVSIVLNIVKPPNKIASKWPKICFFGVFDGHGGTACADYLRDHLHSFVFFIYEKAQR